MTELERAIQWLEDHIKWYGHEQEIANHCRVLLDALRWRNADKELPTKTDWYEATCKSHPHFLSALRYYNGVWLDEKGLEMYWVTHWRPLPEAPKEG